MIGEKGTVAVSFAAIVAIGAKPAELSTARPRPGLEIAAIAGARGHWSRAANWLG
jgi:hypothetical protein